MTDAAPIVGLHHLSKRFGDFTAVDDVVLDIPTNAFFALLGPSGCGKTTLLRMLGGFEQPDEGQVLIDGADVTHVPPNRRPVNMVFQSYAVFPHMSVAANIAYGLKVTGVPAREIGPRVAEALEMVHLTQQADRMPAQLSGGQRQRVALARALVKRPRVLLLDEPLSALDRKLREIMQLELVRLQQQTGVTFVIVTHDQEEALSMATHIAVMNEGRILQVASPRRLYEHPEHRFVAGFIGATNILECEVARVEGDHALVRSALLGETTVERATDTITAGCLVIRPEKLRLRPAGAAPAPAPEEIQIEAQVEQVAYYGDLSFIYLRAADGTRLQCSRYNVNRIDRGDPPPGTPCLIGVHPEDLLLVGG